MTNIIKTVWINDDTYIKQPSSSLYFPSKLYHEHWEPTTIVFRHFHGRRRCRGGLERLEHYTSTSVVVVVIDLELSPNQPVPITGSYLWCGDWQHFYALSSRKSARPLEKLTNWNCVYLGFILFEWVVSLMIFVFNDFFF
jgi:hypothetical protein